MIRIRQNTQIPFLAENRKAEIRNIIIISKYIPRSTYVYIIYIENIYIGRYNFLCLTVKILIRNKKLFAFFSKGKSTASHTEAFFVLPFFQPILVTHHSDISEFFNTAFPFRLEDFQMLLKISRSLSRPT